MAECPIYAPFPFLPKTRRSMARRQGGGVPTMAKVEHVCGSRLRNVEPNGILEQGLRRGRHRRRRLRPNRLQDMFSQSKPQYAIPIYLPESFCVLCRELIL